MKKLVLIKTTENIQAGHLYEHIFCMQLAEYFRSKGLYSYIDYHIDAKTFYSGYVKLEVILYSKAALKHQKAITSFSIVIDDDVIDGAILQIMAEKRVDFVITDYQLLVADLRKYDTKPWKYLDKINYVAPTTEKSKDYIQMTPRDSRHFLILKQTISLDEKALKDYSKDVLYPLFLVISQVLINNFQQVIADTSYCYSYDDYVTVSGKVIKNTNLYRIDKRQEVALTIEKKFTEELLGELFAHGLVGKLETFFKSAIYATPALAPDDDFITENTGVLVGAKGWQAIGSRSNILHVLRYMTIDFKLGKTSDTVSVAAVLKKY